MRTFSERGWLYIAIAVLALGVLVIGAALLLVNGARRNAESSVASLQAEIAQLDRLEPPSGGAEIAPPELTAGVGWRFPIAESDFRTFTSPFGYRVSPLLHVEMYHTGLDIAATWRAQVVAVADGMVTEHWPPPGTPYPNGGVYRGHDVYGGMVEIEHPNGLTTLYAHMSWTRVHTGQRVRAGEVIGRIGDTGQSDGQHLHLEVLGPSGERLNPALYVEEP